MKKPYSKGMTSLFVVATAILSSSSSRADTKLVLERTTARGADVSEKQTFTIYLQGKRARRENPDGTVILYDLETKRATTYDPDRKTFYLKELREPDVSGEDLPSGLRVDTSIKLREEKTTSQRATDDNGSFTLTEQTVTAKLAFKTNLLLGGDGFPGGNGVPPGGGGFPGGRGGGSPGGGRPGGGQGAPVGLPGVANLPETKMEGWVQTVSLSALGLDKKTRDLIEVFIAPILPEGAPFTRKMTEELGKKQLAPLGSHLILTIPDMGNGGNRPGGPSTKALPPHTITVDVAVKSIDSKTPLKESLFVLPEGFTRTSPPPRKMPDIPENLPDTFPGGAP